MTHKLPDCMGRIHINPHVHNFSQVGKMILWPEKWLISLRYRWQICTYSEGQYLLTFLTRWIIFVSNYFPWNPGSYSCSHSLEEPLRHLRPVRTWTKDIWGCPLVPGTGLRQLILCILWDDGGSYMSRHWFCHIPLMHNWSWDLGNLKVKNLASLYGCDGAQIHNCPAVIY